MRLRLLGCALAVLLGLFVTMIPVSTSAATTTLLSTNFDSFPTGPMSIADFRTAMGVGAGGGSSTVARTSIVSAAGHGQVMRQHFHAGQFGPSDGITFFAPLKQQVDDSTLDYDIRFVGFDWGWGGKLPGLGGVNSSVSPSTPTGGNGPTDNGWSGRMMWDTPSSYTGHLSPDEGLAYMYHPTQTDNYGDNVWWHASYTAGAWHHVKVRYKMNTVGASNGILQIWLDGTQVVNISNFVYRTRTDVHISHLYWHLFYGGATKSWAPKVDTNIDVDNLRITAN